MKSLPRTFNAWAALVLRWLGTSASAKSIEAHTVSPSASRLAPATTRAPSASAESLRRKRSRRTPENSTMKMAAKANRMSAVRWLVRWAS